MLICGVVQRLISFLLTLYIIDTKTDMLTCDVVKRLVGFLLTLYIVDRHADLCCCSEVGRLFVDFVHHRQTC